MNFLGIYVMFVALGLKFSSHILAAAICAPIKLKINQVGLCRADGFVLKWDCRQCPPGLGLSVECGRIYKLGTKIHCVICERGRMYSDKNDIGQCKPCNRCQKNEIIKSGECTPVNDTIECMCKPGFYRDRWGHCKPCSWCCGDNSNKHVTECNIPQVPLAKQCSLKIKNSCGPPTSTTTSIPSTTPTTSTTTAPTTTHTRKEELINNSISSDGTSDSNELENTSKDSSKREKKPSSGGTSMKLNLVETILLSFTAVVLVVGILGGIYYGKRRNSRPLLQLNHRFNDTDNGSGSEEVVRLNPNADSAVYHAGRHEGPSGVERSQANGICLPTTRFDEQKLSFISEKLGKKIEDLKHDVMQTLCEMLNVQINGKDYRNLDSFCKLSYYDKKGLEKHDNPMESIIDIMVRDSITLESFLNELYEISRGDVVEKLYVMATKVGSTHER